MEPELASDLFESLGLEALHRYREKFPAWRDADPFQLL